MALENTFTLPASNTLQQNAELWAKQYNDMIKPGHRWLLDFTQCSELEKPTLYCLVNTYGWTLEKPFFIRKPEK